MKQITLFIISAAIALFAANASHADVVPPPPTNCPMGSTPSTSHGGEYCEPTTCASNADCKDGKTCQEVALCVETQNRTSRGGPFTVSHATGTCATDGSCASGGTCQRAKRCSSEASVPTSGCQGLSSQSQGAGAGILLLIALLGVYSLTRKRPRYQS